MFLLLSVNEVIAQLDHLEPSDNIFNLGNRQFEYYSKVRQVLYDGLTDSPEIRYLILPSFFPESVLEIEYDKKKNESFLVYHIGEKMIWHNNDWSNIKIFKYKKIITNENAELIKSLFENAILDAKYTEVPKRRDTDSVEVHLVMVDGESYYFSYFERYRGLIRSGHVLSPKKGTRMSRLVEIGNQLIELSMNNNSVVALSYDLKAEILNLTKDLKINDRQ